jgi:signal transduction histidine kinase
MKKRRVVDADRTSLSVFSQRYRWLLVGFALALVLLGINVAFALHSIGIIAANQALVAHTHEVLLEIAALKLDLVEVQRGLWGFTITGNQELLQLSNSSQIEAGHRFERIVTLTRDNPVQQQRLERLHAYMAGFLAFQQQVKKQAQLSRQRAMVLISGGEGITTLAAIDRIAGDMQDEENRLLSSRSAQSRQTVQRSYATFFVGTGLTLVAVVWLSIGTLRNLQQRHTDAVRIFQLVAEAQTRAEQLESTVARRTLELTEINKALEAFSYSVSHDLKEPLRGMAGMANILVEDYRSSLPQDAHRYLNSIIESAKRMDRLIDNLLAFARLNHGELPLIAVNLDQVISEVCRQFHWQLQESGAVVEVSSPLPAVLANRSALIQVFVNLFSNSLKFARSDTRPEIKIWPEDSDRCVKLWFQDNGLGIAPEDREKVFQPFHQLQTDRVAYSGTGIGLAIVRSALDRMGGTVGIASHEGPGTLLWLSLPKVL